MTETNLDKQLFERAASMLRVQGIISIIFGGLGVFIGFLIMVGFGIGIVTDYSSASAAGALFMAAVTFVFFFLPHIYLIISGVTMLRQPQPNIARILTIINLVVSVFWNWITLVFAIISLAQSGDYERYYNHKK